MEWPFSLPKKSLKFLGTGPGNAPEALQSSEPKGGPKRESGLRLELVVGIVGVHGLELLPGRCAEDLGSHSSWEHHPRSVGRGSHLVVLSEMVAHQAGLKVPL